VTRAAQVLTAVGALDDEAAAQILADFDLALGVRQADPASRAGLLTVIARRGAPSLPEKDLYFTDFGPWRT
jgi:hypothetical protein